MRAFVVTIGLTLGATSAGAADVPDAAAVSRAGQQRMLSQRIVKAYSQIGLNVQPTTAMAQLTESGALFEENLEALVPVVEPSVELRRLFNKLAGAWTPMRNLMSSAVSRDNAIRLAAQAEVVLAAAERLTRGLEDAGKKGISRGVNVAGRQRMLAQRLAKGYLLHAWGVDNSALREEMELAMHEFSGGLASLQALPGNTGEIREEIAEMSLRWEWLKAALAGEGASSYRLIVVESADAILDTADHLTRLYEKLGQR
jgi:nitrate/nitrite-specific signal transduction histidine kinase